MRKKLLSVMLISALLGMATFANASGLSDSLRKDAIRALVQLDRGNYESLVLLLPFDDLSPSASEWQKFASRRFSSLGGGVQTDVSYAYYSRGQWHIAVPVSTSQSDDTECLLILSTDGKTVSGYDCVSLGSVKTDMQNAETTD